MLGYNDAMNKTLTKGQMRELRRALREDYGATPQQVVNLTKPSMAWDVFQRAKQGLLIQGLGAVTEPPKPVQRDSEPPPPKPPEKSRQNESEKRKGRGPGKKPAKVTTSVQLDPDMVEALQVVAEREERTVSAVIRLAIRDYLERVKR
jgi:hypothetical protein